MQPALKQGYAVPCFNVFGYEDALAVVKAAEARNASVILAVNLDMTLFMPLEHIWHAQATCTKCYSACMPAPWS